MSVLAWISLLVLLISIAAEAAAFRQPKPQPGTLYIPLLYRVCLHAIGLAFGLLPVLPPRHMEIAGLSVFCVILIELTAWGSRRYRAALEGDTLFVTPFFGPRRRLPLADITRVQPASRGRGLKLYAGKKLLCTLPATAVGYAAFCGVLKQRGLL